MNETKQVNSIQDCLDLLGIDDNTLSAEEKKSLDEKGYLIIPNVLNQEQIEQWRKRYEELAMKQGKPVYHEGGARRIADMVNNGEEYDMILTYPKLLAAVYHIIGREFKLSSIVGRDALPGHGHQWMHSDFGARTPDEPYHVVNANWMLDDFTAENGASRLVPGSHLFKGLPDDIMPDLRVAHPEQIIIEAPAGSLAIFNAHCWHGGTKNNTDGSRRGIFSYFCAREHPQSVNQRELIRLKVYNRLPDTAKYILDVQ